jgi:G3E family GTPase
VLQLDDQEATTVVQGVHGDVSFTQGRPWGQRERMSRLVFIGRNLHQPTIAQAFHLAVLGNSGA